MRITLREGTDARDDLVATSDGASLGSVGVRWGGFGRPEESAALPGVPEIARLVVRPEARGRGLGSALLRAAEERIAARGVPLAALAVNVENVRARALYERCGYVDVHVSSRGPEGTDALLAKVLMTEDGGGVRPAGEHPVLEAVGWADPRAHALRVAQQDEIRARYALLHVAGATGDAVTGDHAESDGRVGTRVITTLVATLAGRPAGTVAVCGVAEAAAPVVRAAVGDVPTAEIKRLYVAPWARRRGLSRALMARAAAAAAGAGVEPLVLETGRLQPEAIALYAALGFARIPSYPPYVGDPTSLSLARRDLSSLAGATAS